MSTRRTIAGFTLYEMLVAVAIVGLLSSFAFAGFNQLARASEQRGAAERRLAELQHAFVTLTRDLTQADARPVREGFHGSLEPALGGGAGAPALLALTTAGWYNTAGAPRGPLRRVEYSVGDGKLLRRAWRVLDRAPDSQPDVRTLLTGVRGASVEFLSAAAWQPLWPPAGLARGEALRPRAVRVGLDLEDYGRVERVVELFEDLP